MKNNLRKNKDLSLSQLIFEKFVENDNDKISRIIKRILYIYNKQLKLKKYKYFFEFYRKCLIKKEKRSKIKIHDKLYDIINQRKRLRNDLETKFSEKEGIMCTFSPKINKNNFINLNKPLNKYNNNPPIIILPVTSRIYFPNGNGNNKTIKFEELLQNFIEKSSNINNEKNNLDKNNNFIEKEKVPNYIYNYTRKNSYNKDSKNISTLNSISTNTIKIKKEENNNNLINKEYYNTFKDKLPYNSLFNTNNTFKKNNFIKFNSTQKQSYHISDIINKVPKKENNNQNSNKNNKKYILNEKINKIYLKDFSRKHYNNSNNNNKSTKINKRKIQLIKQRQLKQLKKFNTINTNNETKGGSASTLSTRDIPNFKSNSKRESYSNISNYTTNYKTKRKKIKGENKKKENTTLQSLSDSKMMELAEYFLDKKEKDDFLDDVKIKKILVFNDYSSNGSDTFWNKNITFNGDK